MMYFVNQHVVIYFSLDTFMINNLEKRILQK